MFGTIFLSMVCTILIGEEQGQYPAGTFARTPPTTAFIFEFHNTLLTLLLVDTIPQPLGHLTSSSRGVIWPLEVFPSRLQQLSCQRCSSYTVAQSVSKSFHAHNRVRWTAFYAHHSYLALVLNVSAAFLQPPSRICYYLAGSGLFSPRVSLYLSTCDIS